MQLTKYILVIFTMLVMSACIKAYDPVIESNEENKYVVSGRITDKEGWQEVSVSLSSPIESPKNIMVGGCQVAIEDDKGNSFVLDERDPGIYKVWMRQFDLMPGTSYRVKLLMPDGTKLESGYDKMAKCPPLDSVYYAIKEVPTTDPEKTQQTMQFYVNLDAIGDYSKYYKWDITETWEYHAALPAQYYYDGMMHEIVPPDSSKMVCWITKVVKNVFTLSTTGLSQNKYNQLPLHFIDGRTPRLGIQYSILVNQLALSEGAYNYWEQLRINSNEQGGLYEKQPLAVKGNLINVTNPEKEVLGYFYATATSEKRYFYKDVPGIDLDFYNSCSPYPLGRFGFREIFTWEYPVYFYYNEVGAIRLLNNECIDCTIIGGTTEKPDFWPN